MTQFLDQFNQQNLALTLWAYAKLGFEVRLFRVRAPLQACMQTRHPWRV